MSDTPRISRRTVLRGLGATLALPMLDAMQPIAAGFAGDLGTVAAGQAPRRMAFFYVPNGVHMQDWTPAEEGENYAMPAILQPLESLKNDFSILTGLTQDKARANGDGPGDHARAMSAFLTGCQPRKTDGANIRAGVSVDQVAAQRIGGLTRFASLELGCDRGAQSGNCDSGYSCAYSSNLSWKSEAMPMAKEINPRLIFDRLFANEDAGESEATRAKRLKYRKSILDFVLDDAKSLHKRLGVNDRRKMDEYLVSVREIETRISRREKGIQEVPDIQLPDGVPEDYAEHIKLVGDLMVLAFQGDLTRVATFAFANDGSNRPYPFLEVPEGHHELSHHGKNAEKQAKIAKINKFHITQFGYIMEKLRNIPEGDGTLLDNSMIAFGSGISDGDRHNHDDLPVLLFGRGGGTIKPGRHIRYAAETPLNNLWLSMLDRMDVDTDKLGDSTGRINNLT